MLSMQAQQVQLAKGGQVISMDGREVGRVVEPYVSDMQALNSSRFRKR